MPFPTFNHPISPFGGQIPNPHFGAISPNGLNLGLLNVNPLFSLQVTKSEHGEKLVKPFVNLHVTPNEGIVGKIGKLLAHKKGGGHNHYHKHLHRYPSYPYHHGPPHFEGPHGPPHFEGPHGPPHFEGPFGPQFEGPHGPPHPHFEGPPHPHFDGPPHHFEGPPHHHFPGPIHHPFYKDAGHQNDLLYEDSINPGVLGFRSSNVSFEDQNNFPPNNQIDSGFSSQASYNQNLNFQKQNALRDDIRYARQYLSNANNVVNENVLQSIPVQAPGASEGSDMVSFPSSRRRRDTDQVVPASLEKKEDLESVDDASSELDSEGRAYSAGKVRVKTIRV